MARIFLLSPADCGGERARLLESPQAEFPLARRLRSREGAPLGEVFSFLSALYFRGKLAYSLSFAAPPCGAPGVLIITSCRGLRPWSERVTLRDLRRLAGVPIDPREPRYRRALLRDSRTLARAMGPRCTPVLLGSLATARYLEPLRSIFGERLLVPAVFPGMGDMRRGSILLRAVREGRELEYVMAPAEPLRAAAALAAGRISR